MVSLKGEVFNVIFSIDINLDIVYLLHHNPRQDLEFVNLG